MKKIKSILVSREAWLCLYEESHRQRKGCEYTPDGLEFLKKCYERDELRISDGRRYLFDGDLGGKENGRWVSWSCEKMAEILTAAGLEYEPGPEVESMTLL